MNQKVNYIEQLKEKIKEADIRQIASLRFDLVKQGSHHKMLCPFHHDTSIGSFVVGGKRNTFHCFSCGEHGDAITLIQRADGTPFIETILSISEEMGFITADEAEALASNQVDAISISEGDYLPFDATDVPATNIADADVLNNVFTMFAKGNALLGEAKLSEEHYTHLTEDRGLSKEEIERTGFFTMPSPVILKDLFNGLYQEHGYLPTVLKEIPGFYSAKNWKVNTNQAGLVFSDEMEEMDMQLFDRQDGIGIPIRDAQGRVIGIQIRADHGKGRYNWFSSTNVMESKGKFDGVSSGAPKDVVYPEQLRNRTLFITEGKFKALALVKQFGSVAISIQGVTSWRGIEELIKEVQEEIGLSFNHIVIAYDADVSYKNSVLKQTLQLGEALENATDAEIHAAVWDEGLGKGIDDLIQNGHIQSLSRLPFQEFKTNMKGVVKSANKTDEELKKYFIRYVLKTVTKKS